jgi:uroporphyrinogen III methyltransferase/synthase
MNLQELLGGRSMKKGKVYIVGAGPGDMELLTLKAKRCVEEADCIVYDRLINKRILKLAKPNAELIYLGKLNTEGGVIQDEINQTLVKEALKGKVVTRLKGGDPFVFGRGGEEIQEILKEGIPFEVVPGITSSISVPAYSGIPVTHRGISRSFHVFTGHTMEDGGWHNFEAIAKLQGTLVFLMGVKNLDLISGDLIKNGKDPETPVGIIEKGSTSRQRVIRGKLSNIVEIAKKENVKPPAIIIIGGVVDLRDEFNWFEQKELFGKKILVTRDENQAEAMSSIIEKKGGEAVELPLIQIDDQMKDYDYSQIKDYTCLLFNSQNSVRSFFEYLPDMRMLGNIKIGVVGVKTEEELSKLKLVPDFMPKEYLGELLAEEASQCTEKEDKILVVTSDISPIDCEKWSAKYNRNFKKIDAYKTIKVKRDREEVIESLEGVDIVTFLSSSTVEAFVESLEGNFDGIKDVKFASIGPVTSETMKKLGLSVDIEAKTFTAEGVLKAIEEAM